MLSRTLSSPPLSLTAVIMQAILEFSGELPSAQRRMELRSNMLLEQLKPQGEFGQMGRVHATGNGCYTMIGWLEKMLGAADRNILDDSRFRTKNFRRFQGLNL